MSHQSSVADTSNKAGGFDNRLRHEQNREIMVRELNLASRLILVIAGTVAYLGLAILGEGGEAIDGGSGIPWRVGPWLGHQSLGPS
jgi:hypothetical protein